MICQKGKEVVDQPHHLTNVNENDHGNPGGDLDLDTNRETEKGHVDIGVAIYHELNVARVDVWVGGAHVLSTHIIRVKDALGQRHP